jgi:hypothetical protein
VAVGLQDILELAAPAHEDKEHPEHLHLLQDFQVMRVQVVVPAVEDRVLEVIS